MNHWVKEHHTRTNFSVGDYVYWNPKMFTPATWAIIVLQYGVGPMQIIKIYRTDEIENFEVSTDSGFLVTDVNPKNLVKVDRDYEADA